MAIVRNEPCPACQEMGHDARGNHLMVFEDGGKYCSHAHWHKDGLPLYIAPDGSNPILDMDIKGDIKYTPDQFKELEESGKLNDDMVRAVALSGMRQRDRWKVSTEEERQAMLKEKDLDQKYFEGLKVRNLVDRHIPGAIAKFYNVRVGLSPEGKTARHYYPIYSLDTGEWVGAKCRTLPKDFYSGHLGFLGFDNQLFGQHTMSDVLASGERMMTLLLVGGECDAMAAQTMLLNSRKGTKWEGHYFHVWSPTKGECALQEIINNKEEIKKFKKIIVCFDNDEVGNKMNREVAKIFRGKTMRLQLPSGCKDPNDCLKQGREKEFVDALIHGACKTV